MKKLLLVLSLLLAVTICAHAEDIDLSGLSYAELVALKDRINLAMWESDEWQEVIVPQGVWIVGEDIPAGHWTMKPAGNSVILNIGDRLGPDGISISSYSSIWVNEFIVSSNSPTFDQFNHRDEFSYELENGHYIIITGSSVVFTPYTGKPDLGFK